MAHNTTASKSQALKHVLIRIDICDARQANIVVGGHMIDDALLLVLYHAGNIVFMNGGESRRCNS